MTDFIYELLPWLIIWGLILWLQFKLHRLESDWRKFRPVIKAYLELAEQQSKISREKNLIHLMELHEKLQQDIQDGDFRDRT